MNLIDLNPTLSNTGILTFDCPVCCCNRTHRIRVPLAPAVDARGQSWQHTGEFPYTITLSPSVDAGCWHGWIREGKIAQ